MTLNQTNTPPDVNATAAGVKQVGLTITQASSFKLAVKPVGKTAKKLNKQIKKQLRKKHKAKAKVKRHRLHSLRPGRRRGRAEHAAAQGHPREAEDQEEVAGDVAHERIPHIALAIALLAALALLIAAPHARGNFVYWANDTNPGSIGRAKINGTGANNNLITGLNQPHRSRPRLEVSLLERVGDEPNRARQSGRQQPEPELHHHGSHEPVRTRGHCELRDLLAQPRDGQ